MACTGRRREARASESDEVASFLLAQLAGYLDLAGVTDAPLPEPTPATHDVVEDIPDWLGELAGSADLNAVARICTELYGRPSDEFYVAGDGQPAPMHARDDSRRVVDAYRAAGETVAPVLQQRGGNVITSRRALSILFGPDSYERSVADPQTTVRAGKLLDVGCYRAVLLAMLAWAWAGRTGSPSTCAASSPPPGPPPHAGVTPPPSCTTASIHWRSRPLTSRDHRDAYTCSPELRRSVRARPTQLRTTVSSRRVTHSLSPARTCQSATYSPTAR